MTALLCSMCFMDQGIKLDAEKIGIINSDLCPNCSMKCGAKLDKHTLEDLAHRFFVRGTVSIQDYGAAPVVQFNNYQSTDIEVSDWLKSDLNLIEKNLGVGFFYYGPRLWMLGEVEPLKKLQRKKTRNSIITRVINEYPTVTIDEKDFIYRLRVNPEEPENVNQYDSPPIEHSGKNRLDSPSLSILYGSQDLEVCVHECRVTVEDNIYMATLRATRDLKLLDLTVILDEDVTEFESLDIAIHMLFSAGKNAYEICRAIALAAKAKGFDGLIYPSYFSLVRTGAIPFSTVYGMSIRRMEHLKNHARAQIIENIALFGHPVAEGKIEVQCINRLILNKIQYDLQFGPVKV